MLVLRGFTRADMGNVQDGFLVRVQHFTNRSHVAPLVEMVADAQGLQMLIAV